MILPKSTPPPPSSSTVTAIVAGCTRFSRYRGVALNLCDRRRRARRVDDQPAPRASFTSTESTGQSPFKLMDKRSDLASHRITIGEVTWARTVGHRGGLHDRPEKPELLLQAAAAVKETGAHMIAGASGSRTNPRVSRRRKSLDISSRCPPDRLPVDTEVMESAHPAGAGCRRETACRSARGTLNYPAARSAGPWPNAILRVAQRAHMGVQRFISLPSTSRRLYQYHPLPPWHPPSLDGYHLSTPTKHHAALEGKRRR